MVLKIILWGDLALTELLEYCNIKFIKTIPTMKTMLTVSFNIIYLSKKSFEPMKNLFFVLSMVAFIFISGQLSASNSINPILPAEENTEVTDMNRVKVNISVQVKKKTSKGIICEIMSIVIGDGIPMGKNQMAATAEIRGGKLSLRVDKSSTKVTQLIMPKGFTLSRELSLKLGSKKSIVMSGGSTMLRQPKSLLQFEIQM
jgi:hypothetical protein